MARPRPTRLCCSSRCLRTIHPDESAVALTIFSQTVGMGKQRTSKSERLYLCPQCATRTVTSEKEPPKSAPFDVAIFRVLLDLVGAQPDVAEEAFKQLQKRRQDILYSPALTEGEVLPPERGLKAAS